jgi:hypothetical protein
MDKAIAAIAAIPVAGIIALTGAGAASAITCGPGFVPGVAANGAPFCSPAERAESAAAVTSPLVAAVAPPSPVRLAACRGQGFSISYGNGGRGCGTGGCEEDVIRKYFQSKRSDWWGPRVCPHFGFGGRGLDQADGRNASSLDSLEAFLGPLTQRCSELLHVGLEDHLLAGHRVLLSL